MRRIVVTFKQSEADIYEYLRSFSSPTAMIKDQIRQKMREEERKNYEAGRKSAATGI